MANGIAAQHRANTQSRGGQSIWTRIDAGTLTDIVADEYFTFREAYRDLVRVGDLFQVLNADLKYFATLRVTDEGAAGWNTELVTVSMDAQAIEARVAALEVTVGGFSAGIAANTAAIANNSTAITANQNNIATLQANVAGLATSVNAHNVSIAALEAYFAGAADGDILLYTGGAWTQTNLKTMINDCINARFSTTGTAGTDLVLNIDTDGDGTDDVCLEDCNNTGTGGGNNAPTATGSAPADQTVTDGNAIAATDYSGCFNDPDGDALTYSIVPAVAGLSVSAAGVVTGTITGLSTFPASVPVTVRATDPGGLFADCTSTVTVNSAAVVSGTGSCGVGGTPIEPDNWCGVGTIPGTSTVIGSGAPTGTTCGFGITSIMANENSPLQMVIELTAPLPNTVTELTIGVAGVVVDVSAFQGQTNFTVSGVPANLQSNLTGAFTVAGNC